MSRGPISTILLLLWLAVAAAAHAQSVFRLLDGEAGTQDTGSSPGLFVPLANQVTLFAAKTEANGVELWKTDGTTAGTEMVRDIVPGWNDGFGGSMVVASGVAYFVGLEGSPHLWRTDGTTDGTRKVCDSCSDFTTEIQTVGSTIFYNGRASSYELWSTDGSDAGSALLKDDFDSAPSSMTAAGGRLFFLATDFRGTSHLWTSDGTPSGTVQVALPATNPQWLAGYDGALYFTASNSYGTELWRTDGTDAGTSMVRDFAPGSFGSFPSSFTEAGGSLYFIADTEEAGPEIWKTDGTIVFADRRALRAALDGGTIAGTLGAALSTVLADLQSQLSVSRAAS